jgi:competence protein ComEA
MRNSACIVLLALTAAPAAHALDLNRATRAQLERLDGLGVVTVERLLAERARRPFRDWSDLAARVKGLNGRRLEQLQRQGLRLDRAPPAADDTR